MRRRYRRDALRAAAVEYKQSLGKEVLRRWIRNVTVTPAAPSTSKPPLSSSSQMHLLRNCFIEWRNLFTLPTRRFAPSFQYRHRQHDCIGAENVGSSLYLQKETPPPIQRENAAAQSDIGSLLTSKPRIPLHLLHPVQPQKTARISSSVTITPASSQITSPILNAEGAHDGIINLPELARILADIESSCTSAQLTSRGDVDVYGLPRKAEKKRELAAYLNRYADEIERLYRSKTTLNH